MPPPVPTLRHVAASPHNGTSVEPSPGLAFRRLASILGQRIGFGNKAGLSFQKADGSWARDTYEALGYPETITYEAYRAQYERGGIAKRLVEIYPRATWGGGADILEDPDPDTETEFERETTALFDRLDVWSRLLRVDILAGIGQYGALLIGAEGELDQPLPRLRGQASIASLAPLPEGRAKVEKLIEDDTSDPRFGLPEFYQVNLGGSKNQARKVHWSRVIHVAEGLLEDEVNGTPRLQAVWNYLHDLLKTVGGGAEATWRRANRLTLFDLDPEMELAAGEEEALSDAIEDVVHGYKSFARTRGVTPRDLTGTVPAINANARTIEELIAAASGVPHRILFGSERGELASSQDRSNWNDRVSERRREFATPLLGAFLARLIEHGGLPKPESWEAVWPAEDELDETEKAEVVSSFATANKAQVQATGRPVMTSNEIRDSILGLGPLEAIDDFESESEPEPDDEPGIDDVDEVEELRAAADLADREAEEPEWRSVHRAADVHRRGLARLFSESWRDAGQEIDLAALEILLGVGAETRAGDLVVEALARAERSLSAALPTRLLSVVAEGGLAALRSARSRGSWFRAAEFSMSFDAAHPRAEQWAEARAAALIVEVRPEIIAAVRELIVTGLREGVPPRVLAQRIRQSVGLRADQVEAVGNLITELQAAQPGAVVERFAPRKGVRASAGFRARVPVGGATDDWVARQAARYSSMQRNYRARTIARTETLRAANEGQRELWRQGQETGTLDGDQKRVWIATPDDRTRPEHAERDGVEVGIDEPWPWGTEPGEEIACRCAQGLSFGELAREAA